MRVVLAEDSTVMRRMLEVAAQQSGHEVTAVADGQAAWDAFERVQPSLVILDWQMPILDGLEVCRRIRASAARRDTFVLVVTARDATEDLVSALNAGADDYMTKPVTAGQLRARMLIAERRIAQDLARRHAEEALAHAQWLAGIGETTLALQHEINNPLAALIAHAELLSLESGTSEAEHREDLAVISEQARRIAAVVTRLATLKHPRTVEYLAGSRMIDLSGDRSNR